MHIKYHWRTIASKSWRMELKISNDKGRFALCVVLKEESVVLPECAELSWDMTSLFVRIIDTELWRVSCVAQPWTPMMANRDEIHWQLNTTQTHLDNVQCCPAQHHDTVIF